MSTVDFYYTLYWTDARFAMPAFWNAADPFTQQQVVKLARFFRDPVGLFAWLPDFLFHDGLSIQVQGEVSRCRGSQ